MTKNDTIHAKGAANQKQEENDCKKWFLYGKIRGSADR